MAVLALAGLSAALAGAENPYIHAPSPPYCSPRGGAELCVSDPETSPPPKVDARTFDVEYVPELNLLVTLSTRAGSIQGLGSVALTLYGTVSEGPAIGARATVESSLPLSRSHAESVKSAFSDLLEAHDLLWIEIERVSRGSKGEPEPDGCSFDREDVDGAWELVCDAP